MGLGGVDSEGGGRKGIAVGGLGGGVGEGVGCLVADARGASGDEDDALV